MSWTNATAKAHIKRMLGGSYRAVELKDTDGADDDYLGAIGMALAKLNSKIPNFKRGSFSVVESQNKYDFSAGGLNKSYGRGVVEVTLEPLISPNDVFSEAEYFRVRQPPYIAAGDLVADKIYYKELGIIVGTDFDWKWFQAEEILMISPTPTRSCGASYIYRDSFETIEDVPGSRQSWVVDYSLALCKQIVGEVRGKFGGQIPGNELSVEVNGSDLKQEGRDEAESLLESLSKSRGHWTPPIKG